MKLKWHKQSAWLSRLLFRNRALCVTPSVLEKLNTVCLSLWYSRGEKRIRVFAFSSHSQLIGSTPLYGLAEHLRNSRDSKSTNPHERHYRLIERRLAGHSSDLRLING
jgi:hypothetical protein